MATDIRLRSNTVEVHAPNLELRRQPQDSPMLEASKGTLAVGGAGFGGGLRIRSGGGEARIQAVAEGGVTNSARIALDGSVGEIFCRREHSVYYNVMPLSKDDESNTRGQDLVGLDKSREAMRGSAELVPRDLTRVPDPTVADTLADVDLPRGVAGPGSIVGELRDLTNSVRDGLPQREYRYTLHIGEGFDVVEVDDLKVAGIDSLIDEIKDLKRRIAALENS